jgi:transcriptional regulator with XRE-family HTH domain
MVRHESHGSTIYDILQGEPQRLGKVETKTGLGNKLQQAIIATKHKVREAHRLGNQPAFTNAQREANTLKITITTLNFLEISLSSNTISKADSEKLQQALLTAQHKFDNARESEDKLAFEQAQREVNVLNVTIKVLKAFSSLEHPSKRNKGEPKKHSFAKERVDPDNKAIAVFLPPPSEKQNFEKLISSDPESVSIKDLSTMITGLKNDPEREDILEDLTKIRRRKAIQVARMRRGITVQELAKLSKKTIEWINQIEVGTIEITSTELRNLLDIFPRDKSGKIAKKIISEIKEKNDNDRMSGLGSLLSEMRQAAGLSQKEIGEVISLGTLTIILIEKGTRRISVENVNKILKIAEERRLESNDAISVLKADLEVMEEEKQQYTPTTIAEAFISLRKEHGLSQKTLAQLIPGFNQVAISRLETEQSTLTEERLLTIIEAFVTLGSPQDSKALKFLMEELQRLRKL